MQCKYQHTHTIENIINALKFFSNNFIIYSNYIKGFFILDAFSCLNIELVMTFSSSAIFSKMVVFSKLLRISTFMIYMERFRERHQISMYKFKVFKLIVIPSVLLMWLGSAFFMVGLVSNEKWLQQKHKNSAMGFLVCYQRASNYFFLLGDDILSKYSWSIILETTSMFLGVLYYLFMMGNCFHFFTNNFLINNISSTNFANR